MIIKSVSAPFSNEFISEFTYLTQAVFSEEADQAWLNSLEWRLRNMPDVMVFVAKNDSDIVGYKAGYAIAQDRYYSWLGGVDPVFRRQGIASHLMKSQSDWLAGSVFKILETHVMENNSPMIALNLKAGFKVIGNFQKNDSNCLIMQKSI